MDLSYIKVFTDALDTWSLLSDEEVGRLVRALLEYQRTGQYPVLPGNERFLFHTCKAQIDRDNEKYRETVSSRSNAGKKGACPDGKAKQRMAKMANAIFAMMKMAKMAKKKKKKKTKTKKKKKT